MKVASELFDSVSRRCSLIGAYISRVCLFLMTMIVAAEIIARSGFRFSLPVAVELPIYLFGGVVFLELAHAFRDGTFLRADILYSRFSSKTRGALDMIFLILALAFVVIMTKEFIALVISSIEYGERSYMQMKAPLFIPRLLLPVGFILLGLELVAKITKATRG